LEILSSTGKLGSVGMFVNDNPDGKWTYYYETGEKWREGNYKNGLREGKWVAWYEIWEKTKRRKFCK